MTLLPVLGHLEVLLGVLIIGACCFLAGWKTRGERDLYLRASGRKKRTEMWPPW